MTTQRNPTVQELRKLGEDSYLLDLLKLMPDNWTLEQVLQVIPQRKIVLLAEWLNLTENQDYYDLTETQYQADQKIKDRREREEMALLKDMIGGKVGLGDIGESAGVDYEASSVHIEHKLNEGTVAIIKRWMDGEDFEDYAADLLDDDDEEEDEDSDESWMDEGFDDDDLDEEDEDDGTT